MALPLLTRRLAVAGLAAACLLAAPHGRALARGAASEPVAGSGSAGGAAQEARSGTIEGTVELDLRPARRTAARYPGQGAGPARAVQRLPAVVWIRGPVAGASAPAAAGAAIAQRDTAFDPGVLVVPAGSAVAFPNRDPFFHNVFSFSPAQRFDLGRYPRGESKTVTFEEPGVVKVYCEVHESMRALVVVTESPFHAVVDDEGRFTLRDVPAGRHTLVLLHADLGTREATVDVPASGVARVRLTLP